MNQNADQSSRFIIDGVAPGTLTKIGTFTVEPSGMVLLHGFEGDGCSCRELCLLALEWARDEGEEDIPDLDWRIADIRARPGGGRVGVAD